MEEEETTEVLFPHYQGEGIPGITVEEKESGIYVKEVLQHSPAARVGEVREGDQIVGATIYFEDMSSEEVQKLLKSMGQHTLGLKLQRKGDRSPRCLSPGGEYSHDVFRSGSPFRSQSPEIVLSGDEEDYRRIYTKKIKPRLKSEDAMELEHSETQTRTITVTRKVTAYTVDVTSPEGTKDIDITSPEFKIKIPRHDIAEMSHMDIETQKGRTLIRLPQKIVQTSDVNIDLAGKCSSSVLSGSDVHLSKVTVQPGSPGIGLSKVLDSASVYEADHQILASGMSTIPKVLSVTSDAESAKSVKGKDITVQNVDTKSFESSGIHPPVVSAGGTASKSFKVATSGLNVKYPETKVADDKIHKSLLSLSAQTGSVSSSDFKSKHEGMAGTHTGDIKEHENLQDSKGGIKRADIFIQEDTIKMPGFGIKTDTLNEDGKRKEEGRMDKASEKPVSVPKTEIGGLKVDGDSSCTSGRIDNDLIVSQVHISVPKIKGSIKTSDTKISGTNVDLSINAPESSISVPQIHDSTGFINSISISGTALEGDSKAIKAGISDTKIATTEMKLPKTDVFKPEREGRSIQVTKVDTGISKLKPEVSNVPALVMEGSMELQNTDSDSNKGQGKSPKFWMPKFGKSSPKPEKSIEDIKLSQAEIDISVPHAKYIEIKEAEASAKAGEIKETNLNIPGTSISSGETHVKAKGQQLKLTEFSSQEVKVELEGHDIHVKGTEIPDTDINVRDVGGSLKKPKFTMPTFGLQGPKTGKPELDLRLEKPDTKSTWKSKDSMKHPKDLASYNIETDIRNKLEDTKAHNIALQDVQIKILKSADDPDDDHIKIPEGKLSCPTTEGNVHIPRAELTGPAIDFAPEGDMEGKLKAEWDISASNISDQDYSIKGPKLKGESHSLQLEANMKGPRLDVRGPKVNVETPDMDVKGTGTKLHMPKFKIPEFHLHEPMVGALDTGMKAPKADIDISCPKVRGDVKLPDVNLQAADIDVEMEGPEGSLKGPKIKMPGLSLSGPKFSLPDVQIKGHTFKGDMGASGPETEGDRSLPKAKIIGPDIDSKAAEIDIEGQEGKLKATKFKTPDISFSGPKLSMTDVDLKAPKLKGDVPSMELEGKVKGPKMYLKGTADELETPDMDIEGSHAKLKILKPKMPGMSLQGPKLEAPDIDMKEPKVEGEVKYPEVDIQAPDVDVEVEGPEGKLKGPKLKMPDMKWSAPKISLPGVHLKGPKLKGDVNVSGPEVGGDINLPKGEITGSNVDLDAPEYDIEGPEGKLKGPKFKMPDWSMSAPKLTMPDLHFKRPNVKGDVPSMELEGDIEGPKLDAKGLQINLETPDIDVERTGAKLHMPKLKMPGFNLHGPKVGAPDIDMKVPKADIDISCPKVEGDVKLPDVDIQAPDIDVEMEGPEGGLKGPKIKMPGFNLSAPKFSLPDVQLKGPKFKGDMGVSGPKIEGDISLPTAKVKGPDIDFKAPEVDVEGPEGKLKAPKFKKPDISFSGPKISVPDIHIKTPKLKGDVPSMELEGKVKGPKMDLKGSKAELETPDMDIEGSSAKLKMPKVKMPGISLHGSQLEAPGIDMKAPKGDLDMSGQKVEGAIKIPKVDIQAPDVDVEVEGPEGRLKGPKLKMPGFKWPSPKISLPDAHLKGPSLKGDIDVSVPTMESDVKFPKAEFTGPDIAFKAPELGIEGPEGKLKSPKFKTPECEFSAPKSSISDFNIKDPKLKADLPFMKVGDLKGSDLHFESPVVDLGTQDADIEGSSGKVKMPKLKLPEFDLHGHELEEHDIHMNASKVDIGISGPKVSKQGSKFSVPKVSVPGVHIQGPAFSADLDASSPEMKGAIRSPALKVHGPETDVVSFGSQRPKLKTSGLQVKGGTSHGDVDLSVSELEIQGPKVDIKGLDAADIKSASKGKRGKFKMPKFIVGSKLKGKKNEMDFNTSPDVDLDLKSPVADVNIPSHDINLKGDINVKAHKVKKPFFGKLYFPDVEFDLGSSLGSPTFGGEIKAPELDLASQEIKAELTSPKTEASYSYSGVSSTLPDVTVEESEIKIKKTRAKFPKFNFSGSKPKVPDIGSDYKSPQADINFSLPDSDVNSGVPEADLENLAGNMQVSKMQVPPSSILGSLLPAQSLDINLEGAGLKGNVSGGKSGRLDFDGPDLHLKAPSADIKGLEGTVQMQTNIPECPQVSGSSTDMYVRSLKGNLDFSDQGSKAGFKVQDGSSGITPSANLEGVISSVYVVENSFTGSNIDVTLPSASIGMPNFNVPSSNLRMLSTSITTDELSAPEMATNLKPELKTQPEISRPITGGTKGLDVTVMGMSGLSTSSEGVVHLKGPNLLQDADISSDAEHLVLDKRVPGVSAELDPSMLKFKSDSADVKGAQFSSSSSFLDASIPYQSDGVITLHKGNQKHGHVELPIHESGIQDQLFVVHFPKLKLPRFVLSETDIKEKEIGVDAHFSEPHISISKSEAVSEGEIDINFSRAKVSGPGSEASGFDNSNKKTKGKMQKLFSKSKSKDLDVSASSEGSLSVSGSKGELKSSKASLGSVGIESERLKLSGGVETDLDTLSPKGKSSTFDFSVFKGKKSRHRSSSLSDHDASSQLTPTGTLEHEGATEVAEGEKSKGKHSKLKFGTFGGIGAKSKGSYEVTVSDEEVEKTKSSGVSLTSKKTRMSSSSSSESTTKEQIPKVELTKKKE